jgi:transcriptional regulator with XRE-family HTH domain
MESDELRFKHIGLSSDGAVIFCEMDNGKTYAMPRSALERADDWNPNAKPRAAAIIHDGYAAIVEFDTGVEIDFPSDFVLHVCEPSYAYYKNKGRATSGIGGRIREIREARGMTLDALTAKCGIAKPNLSRIENEKVTPTLATITTLARALHTHPVLLLSAKKPEHAWTWTLHQFIEWKQRLHPEQGAIQVVHPAEMVKVFLATRPEHKYARSKLLKYANPNGSELAGYSVDAEEWAREVAASAIANTQIPRSK